MVKLNTSLKDNREIFRSNEMNSEAHMKELDGAVQWPNVRGEAQTLDRIKEGSSTQHIYSRYMYIYMRQQKQRFANVSMQTHEKAWLLAPTAIGGATEAEEDPYAMWSMPNIFVTKHRYRSLRWLYIR